MKNFIITFAILCILSVQLVNSAENYGINGTTNKIEGDKYTVEKSINEQLDQSNTSEAPKKNVDLTTEAPALNVEIKEQGDTPDNTTTTSTTSVAPPIPDNNTTTTTTTTIAPTPDNTTTTTVAPTTSSAPTPVTTTVKPTPSPDHDRSQFSVTAFIGGMVFAFGMMAIGFIAFKFYKARNERNYHTL